MSGRSDRFQFVPRLAAGGAAGGGCGELNRVRGDADTAEVQTVGIEADGKGRIGIGWVTVMDLDLPRLTFTLNLMTVAIDFLSTPAHLVLTNYADGNGCDSESTGMNIIETIPIPPGKFQMGSEKGLPLELPLRLVTIEYQFSMAIHPITQSQWKSVMRENPSEFALGGEFPVQNVSWNDAKEFCARLSEQAGKRIRLPTEAEWEYACRAGSTTEFHFGDDEHELAEYAWFDLNSRGQPHEVGHKRPNAWGLHDMIGSVWEWCEDVWHSDYQCAPSDGSAWMEGEIYQPRRCLRGGSWNYDAFRCRSAYRSREWKDFNTDHFGFRVVVEAQN